MALIRASMPVGVVVRRTPGVTRWAKYAWKVVAVLPGAGPADWRELRRDGEAVEYHAATLTLDLWSSDTEAYRVALAAKVPGVYVVMQEDLDRASEVPWIVTHVTASAYEAQDYLDSGEGMVEQVPMPLTLMAWVLDFVQTHHEEEAFVKRRRDRKRVDLVEDGKGDARVRQVADVFRSPASRREGQGETP